MTAATEFSAVGHTVTYGGLQIGGSESDYTWYPPQVSMSARLVYDDADRAVRHKVLAITVKTIVIADDTGTQDSQMAAIRRILEKPGLQLDVVGIGAGLSSNVKDYAWGPKPRVVELKPLCHLAWSLVWTVEVAQYACATVNENAWESFNFQQEWGVDLEGKTTRTIQGTVVIPANRRFVTGTRPTADRVRDYVTVQVPEGFRRIAQRYNESPDKKTLTFTVVDQELRDDPLPFGIIDAQGSRSVATEGPAFSKGGAQLTMSLTVAPGYPKNLAALHFFKEVIATGKRLYKERNGRATVIPRQLVINHELWSRTSSFVFSWELVGCLMDLLLANDLYEPVAGTDYRQWRQSVEHLWKPRGIADLRANPYDDAIIDVCSNIQSALIGGQEPTYPIAGQQNLGNLLCDNITEDKSWIEYQTVVKYKSDQDYQEHRRAVDYTPSASDEADGSGYVSDEWSYGDGTGHAIEYVGYPTQRVLLQWKGMRLKYKPEPPKLVSIGGRTATKIRRYGEGPRIVAMSLDCPIYFERVSIEYAVTEPIKRIEGMRQETMCSKEGEKDKA